MSDIDFDTLWENLEPHVPTKRKEDQFFGFGLPELVWGNYGSIGLELYIQFEF
ncbi:MAG: hypothetical protein IPN46_19450 [Saprospiraceae bacterium]|nr:hypothetical protein [Saprospiraceae bacterium]